MGHAITARSGGEGEGIAVVAMAGRYPGSASLEAFWKTLCAGESQIRDIPLERWDADLAFSGADGFGPSRRGAFLDSVADFDFDFFGLTPEAASSLDPQARLFLEVAWEALETAGYAGDRARGRRAGVWVGYGYDHYNETVRQAGLTPSAIGSAANLAGKFSSFADWRGPSVVVNALCASSLLALHQAAVSLRTGECDLALVGGVSAALGASYYLGMHELGALSSTGQSRPFDAAADGFVPGEGAGAIVLKRLADARRDGDQILGVVRATAVNHGGQSSRLFAMNLDSQVSLITDVLARAGVSADTIGYVEAHAVGTRLGDAIEVAALSRVFATSRHPPGHCVLGSLKSQFGHLEAASGIASLQKVLLSMKHRRLLPTIGIDKPNPMMKLDASPFRILQSVDEWPAGQTARRACVTAMSMHGVNTAVVLEEAPAIVPRMPASEDAGDHLLVLSARGPEALAEMVRRYLPTLGTFAPGDICFTAAVGRSASTHRIAVSGKSAGALRAELESLLQSGALSNVAATPAASPKFAFHFLDIGPTSAAEQARKELYALHRELARRNAGDILDALPPDYFDGNDESWGKCAVIARDVARAMMWQSNGVVPTAVYGTGLGALTAACVAGRLQLSDCFELLKAARDPVVAALELTGEIVGGAVQDGTPVLLAANSGSYAGASRGGSPSDASAAPLDSLSTHDVSVVLSIGTGYSLNAAGHSVELAAVDNDALGLRAIGALWCAGVAIDWNRVYRTTSLARVPLPSYPFQRQRCWLDAPTRVAAPLQPPVRVRASGAAVVEAPPLQTRQLESAAGIDVMIASIIGRVRPDRSDIAGSQNLLEAGLDSSDLTSITHLISEALDVSLSPILLFEYSSIDRVAAHLTREYPAACERARRDTGSAQVPSSATESVEPMHELIKRMEARLRALEERKPVS